MFIVCSHVSETLVGPLQEKMDDWKKAATILDKDHAKGDLIFSFRLKVITECTETRLITLCLYRFFVCVIWC